MKTWTSPIAAPDSPEVTRPTIRPVCWAASPPEPSVSRSAQAMMTAAERWVDDGGGSRESHVDDLIRFSWLGVAGRDASRVREGTAVGCCWTTYDCRPSGGGPGE